jgi:hypothetical protein
MSNLNNVLKLYWSNYPDNSNVQLVHESSYPNNPGVLHVGLTSDYPHNSDVMHVFKSNYPYNPGVQLIYMTGCFPKSELVHTYSDAYVPIGSLKVGDKINSWDMEQKKIQYTTVTKIHKYTVNDIMCLNNVMRVSSSHPLMVVENGEDGILMPKWKVAFDVNVGDCVVGAGGKIIVLKTKSRHWYKAGIEVLNLSTDSGVPFLVGNYVVRAENAQDDIEWADAPLTQKLAA